MQRKIKHRISDFSGKYHGKLNDKRFEMTEKQVINATVEKRPHQRNHSNLKGKHNGKIRVITCAKHRLWLDT